MQELHHFSCILQVNMHTYIMQYDGVTRLFIGPFLERRVDHPDIPTCICLTLDKIPISVMQELHHFSCILQVNMHTYIMQYDGEVRFQ
jgi:uncharacterized membrane protein YhfC